MAPFTVGALDDVPSAVREVGDARVGGAEPTSASGTTRRLRCVVDRDRADDGADEQDAPHGTRPYSCASRLAYPVWGNYGSGRCTADQRGGRNDLGMFRARSRPANASNAYEEKRMPR